MGRIARRAYEKPVAYEKLLQQPAYAFVVIDDQQMCVWIAHPLPSLSA